MSLVVQGDLTWRACSIATSSGLQQPQGLQLQQEDAVQEENFEGSSEIATIQVLLEVKS
jgi:hypothetical protein